MQTMRTPIRLESLEIIKTVIEREWENLDTITPNSSGDVRMAVEDALTLLDIGELRVAEKSDKGGWIVNEWVKKAILMFFRLSAMTASEGGPANTLFWDKIPSKFHDWDEAAFRQAGFRVVPDAVARYAAYIAPDVVLMPSFVNIGAYIGKGTMVDTWATIGSCAQIGERCHISGGAGIGGVLEPLQATPTIIEDNVFVGARSEVAEGVIVGQGSVLSMGVFLGASTKIIDRETGEIHRGHVPPFSVVVPGTLPGKTLPDGSPGPSLYCAVIVKRVNEKTRAKTGINELLRT